MTQVLINNEPVNAEFETNTTVNDLVTLILNDVASEDEVISSIKFNGRVLTIDEEDQCLVLPVDSFNDIDFTLINSLSLAFDSLDDCSGYIDVVINKISELSTLYSQNDVRQANILFGEVVEIMNLFVQLVSKIHKTIRKNYPTKLQNNETLQKLEIHLLSVLKALLPAKEKEDIIMLCDLLEYELVDNLTQWKIQAIPELKRIRDN